MSVQHEVIILGGGPAGSATALQLARRGCSVAVLERSAYKSVRVGETLPPSINPQLESLGLWRTFLDGAHLPAYGVRSAWGGEELYDNAYIFSPYGNGWHVDRCSFDAMITQGAARAGAVVHQGVRVTNCSRITENNWLIEFLQNGELKRLNARFLVDATGRCSSVRQNLGVEDKWHDQLIGVVSFYEPKDEVAFQEACTMIESAEHGWWYSAELPANRMIVVYMTDLDLYLKQHTNKETLWSSQLRDAHHTYSRVRHLRRVGRPRVFQAGSHRVESLRGSNWFPVGDAAASMDPLCGNGVVSALQTAASAAERIVAFLEGDSNTALDHVNEVTTWFERYMDQRRRFYSEERRWPHSIFWQRRQGDEKWLS